MRFWDASAIVPLLVDEPQSLELGALLADDPGAVVWWGTRTECVSALRRRERDGSLGGQATREAIDALDQLADAWYELLPAEIVRLRAERALAVHPLRAAGALQLSAAITWREAGGDSGAFVCLDERLRDAAGREGFRLLPA